MSRVDEIIPLLDKALDKLTRGARMRVVLNLDEATTLAYSHCELSFIAEGLYAVQKAEQSALRTS